MIVPRVRMVVKPPLRKKVGYIIFIKLKLAEYRCGPSLDPSIGMTHYFKGERES